MLWCIFSSPRGPTMDRSNLPPNTLFLSPIVICLSHLFQALQTSITSHTSSISSSSYFDIAIIYTSKIFIASAFNPRAITHSNLSNSSLNAFEPLLLRFFQPFHIRNNTLHKRHFVFHLVLCTSSH